jgi:glycosyltransferase involved in cell wall biosynthesis
MAKSIQKTKDSLNGKRVIFVLFSFELGGAERQALYLARYLQDVCKAQVEVWAFCNPGRLIEICVEFGIKWRLIPLKLNFDKRQIIINSIELWVALRKAHPDILLPYLTPANIYCGLIWRFTGAKVCIWNQRSAGVERVDAYFEKIALNNVTTIISNSKQGADYLSHSFNIDQRRIHVIPNGVLLSSPQKTMEIWRNESGVVEGEFVACMVANLHGGKDHETLLRAWSIARKSIKQGAHLLLAGRFDATYEELQALVRELQIEHNVSFLGQVNDISGLLHIADLGILLSPFSNWEGTANVILEYMNAGLPVISTDIPAIRETVGTENYPYLVPIKDYNKTAQLIIGLANDAKLRKQIGKRNLERVVTEFTLEKMLHRHTKVIKENL